MPRVVRLGLPTVDPGRAIDLCRDADGWTAEDWEKPEEYRAIITGGRRSMVQLFPMTAKEFEEYLERDIERYAEENVKAGYCAAAEALEESRKAHQQLLPQGMATEDHHFLNIQDESGKTIGTAWLKANRDTALPSGFLYALFIEEAHRGQGYGRQAMVALEEKARELDLRALALHVFAHNAVARAFYERLGYEVKSLNMTKVVT